MPTPMCAAPTCIQPATSILPFWTTLPYPLQHVDGQWCLPLCDTHSEQPQSEEA